MLAVNSDVCIPLKIEQKGYREELLCGQCETRLSKWEGIAKRNLVDIANLQSNFLHFHTVRIFANVTA
jgi:hypothetical protein